MDRRAFLTRLGLGAAAVVAAPIIAPASTAPLFVPSERLAFGVPTQRLVLSANVAQALQRPQTSHGGITAYYIPMLLTQDNYLPEYGGRLPSGAEVMVDRATADRWVAHGVAVPGLGAPRDVQERWTRQAESRESRQDASYPTTWDAPLAEEWTRPPYGPPRTPERTARLDAGWQRMFAGARRDGWEVG
jgi:hypothetical protein